MPGVEYVDLVNLDVLTLGMASSLLICKGYVKGR